MANEILNSLLKDYEKKKLNAEQDSEKRKNDLYVQIPNLKEIEDELNNFAISVAKSILQNGNYTDEQEKLESKIAFLKQKKLDILRNYNIPANYLEPKYECSLCKDTGYISDANHKSIMCNCLRQRLLNYSFNQSNMSNLDKENFSTFNPNIFSDEVDIAKYKFNISPRRNMLNIKDKCIAFVDNFDNPNYKNLLFTGNTGLR